jgi:hypothetical protein
MTNKSTPCAWAIAYKKGEPYGLATYGDCPLLDSEIQRMGGTAHKMPLYAEPALCWTSEKPTKPGWYAWTTKNGPMNPYLTCVYIDDNGVLIADMKDGDWEHDMPLREVADREWYGPIPL